MHDPWGILAGRIPNACACIGSGKAMPARVYVDDRIAAVPEGALILRPRSLVAGIGCNRNTRPEEMKALLFDTLHGSGLARASLRSLASVDVKADEVGLAALAEELDLSAGILRSRADRAVAERGAHPFGRRRETHRSAERMRSRSHPGVARRDADRSQADLDQRDGRHRPHQLYIVGIGPGRLEPPDAAGDRGAEVRRLCGRLRPLHRPHSGV